MTPLTQDALADTASLDELYPKLGEISVCPGWNKPNASLWPSPRKSFRPFHWSYAQNKGALDAAGRLINVELAERRNLLLVNPVEGNTYGTLRTLVSAYQMILPGEKAPSHRHVPNALRYVVDAGEGTYTIVNGQKLAMRPGDVLLTPNWCWHGHANEGQSAAYWIDYLDVPLVQLLEPMFFERHPEEFEPEQRAVADSPWIFSWSDTERKLNQSAADATGRFGVQVELTAEPGQPAMETIALFMMRLHAGRSTAPYQTTANNIYTVVKGTGTTMVEGKRIQWERGDVVAVPSWYEHYHQPNGEAVLFRVTDAPVMSKLGYLREGQPAK